jgi:hypothetical protein
VPKPIGVKLPHRLEILCRNQHPDDPVPPCDAHWLALGHIDELAELGFGLVCCERTHNEGRSANQTIRALKLRLNPRFPGCCRWTRLIPGKTAAPSYGLIR